MRSSTSSTPSTSPRPRTSPTICESAVTSRSPARSCSPRRRAFRARSSLSRTSSTASAAAHGIGEPASVDTHPPRATSRISPRPITADNGSPPPSALPNATASGTISACSYANSFPVRPRPTLISSSTSQTSAASQRSRSAGSTLRGGTMSPPFACTGSKKTAAVRPRAASARSTPPRHASEQASVSQGPAAHRYGSGYGSSVTSSEATSL